MSCLCSYQNWFSSSLLVNDVTGKWGTHHFPLHWRHNGAIAPQITSLTIVYSTVYSDANQRKHHSSASLAFVWGIHRGPVNSQHKCSVTQKMFPFDDVIMHQSSLSMSRTYLANEQRRLYTFTAHFEFQNRWCFCTQKWLGRVIFHTR